MSQTAVRQAPDASDATLSEADFRALSELVSRTAGIVLVDSKRDMVARRLRRRLRALRLTTFSDYRTFVEGPTGAGEISLLLNSITTNHTSFFRENHHFDHLRDDVIGEYLETARRRPGARLRIWSAGCSMGQEPYTIAMTLAARLPRSGPVDARVLATDIDTQVLEVCRRGVYSAEERDRCEPDFRKYFEDVANGDVRIRGDVRRLVAFNPLNLMETWPMRGPFDAIFCRNVMIYFDAPTTQRLVRRFAEMLRPGGWLYIGHSERIADRACGLSALGRTIYQRTA
ncbi:MAG: CheR family methyltransferase [Pseudomonadota bacterium]